MTCREIRSAATFGEDAAADTEEDCWLVMGTVTNKVANEIVDRSRPLDRRSGTVIFAAFPSRTQRVRSEEAG